MTPSCRPIKDDTVSISSLQREKTCAICLEEVMLPTNLATTRKKKSSLPSNHEIYIHNSLTLCSSDDSSHYNNNNTSSTSSSPSPTTTATKKSSSTKKYLVRKKSSMNSSNTKNKIKEEQKILPIDKNQFMIQGNQCKHVFHRGCIRPWLEQGKVSCPCCRKDIINPEDFKTAVVSVLRKERLQMMQRWGIRDDWIRFQQQQHHSGV